MAVAIVQKLGNTGYYTTGTFTGGNCVVWVWAYSDLSGPPTVTISNSGSGGQNLTQGILLNTGASNQTDLGIWYLCNINSGHNQIVSSIGGGVGVCYELSGVVGTTADDVKGTTGTSVSPDAGAMTATADGLAIGAIHHKGGSSVTFPSGWTADYNPWNPSWYGHLGSFSYGAAGSINDTWTIPSAFWAAATILLKGSSGAAAAGALPFLSRHHLPHLIMR